MKQLTPILLAFIFCFCTNKKEQDENGANPGVVSDGQKKIAEKLISESNILSKNKIELETFTAFPKDIDGCGCVLFLSKQDWQEENYIYADAGNIACVKVNGELQLLDLKEYDEQTSTYLYSNKLLTIKIEHVNSTLGPGEETSNVEKVITLTKGTEQLKQKAIGYCGC